LGLTSLDLQQRGQQNLSAADARNPAAPLFNPESQLLTPYQSGILTNEQNRINLDWLRALTQPTLGGGRGGGGGAPVGGTTAPDMSWFSRALNAAVAQNPATAGASYGPPSQTSYGPITDLDYGYGDTSPGYDIPSGYDPFAAYV
jgi:hypothetical protein